MVWRREPGSVVLDLAAFALLAEPSTTRQVRAGRRFDRHHALEPFSAAFAVAPLGTRVTVDGTLCVMAGYEIESSGPG